MMKVIVCGGRDYGFTPEEKRKIFAALDKIHAKHPITILVHGACKGVDLLCEEWAKLHEITYYGYPAKWKQYGPSAGPIRNANMLNCHHDAKCLIAFPGNKGTKDMMKRCSEAHLKVLDMSQSSIFR